MRIGIFISVLMRSLAGGGGGGSGPAVGDGLLLEDGDFLLLEDGSFILLE